MKKQIFPSFIAISLLTFGCIAEPVEMPPTAMPALDGGIRVRPPVQPDPFPVDLRSVDFGVSDQIIPLLSGGIVTRTGTVVEYRANLGQSPVVLNHAFSALLDAETLPWGSLLLWTGSEFFIWEDDQVVRSPISEKIPVTKSGELLIAPGPSGKKDVWITTDSAVFLWREEQAIQLDFGPLAAGPKHLRFGAPWNTSAATWLGTSNGVDALVETGTVTTRYQSLVAYPVDNLVIDFEGTVWVLTSGRLFSRDWDNNWVEHLGLGTVLAIAGHRDSKQLWLMTKRMGLWSHRGGNFQPAEWSDNGLSLDSLDLEKLVFSGLREGQLIVGDHLNRYVVTPGRFLNLEGLEDGSLLTSTVSFDVRVSEPQTVDEIQVFLDGQPLSPASSPSNFSISPAGLADGSHEISVNVSYLDGAPDSRLVVRFSVYSENPPTWVNDIFPIFQNDCEVCHGLRGSARLLSTPDLWRSDIDIILDVVRKGTMPLPPSPPLSEGEIIQIEGWKAAGYLE
ncbi:MAG: Ig-like domain-containing protein [Myxococcota bacterium]|nr:Ig-like domain-containing protein [Myxococcota bacterium]